MQSTELGSRLSGLLERYQQYQDEVVSLHSWLSTQEQNQSIAKASAETDPQNLQNTLRQVQVKHAMTNTCINEHKMTEKRENMQLRHIQKHGLICSLHSIAVYHAKKL